MLGSPKRSALRLATGRAPMVKTSRRMPPTPGRRALVGLDVGGVVVALHLEDGGLAVADIDDAGILARPWITHGALVGSFFSHTFEDL
jgi:hypothetical protein